MFLALIFAFAGADGFDARVQAAKALETNAEGKAFQAKLWDKIGNPSTDALKGCIKSNAPADTQAFTLAAAVDAEGQTSHVVVQPATPVATCFAGQFSTWSLPAPPKTPRPYPIEIDITMTE
ncbi:MAG TPA: peptidase C13 [Luteibacter sp.]|jgi:hypothetical protein|uniref:peptidase C13 n=1 Tax=Luteibacter sp. TaxID=1886636 RepID=UPI002F42DBCF